MNETNKLSKRGAASKVNDAFKLGVVVRSVADLDEEDFVPKMIDYFLISLGRPPFDRNVMLTACDHDPKRKISASILMNLRVPGSFFW